MIILYFALSQISGILWNKSRYIIPFDFRYRNSKRSCQPHYK